MRDIGAVRLPLAARGRTKWVFRRGKPLKPIHVLVAAGWIAYVWMDAGSHHFSAGYRLNALVWTGLWVALLLFGAVRLLIGFGRESPGQSAGLANRDEYVEAHQRRSLGRKPVVVGVAIAALWTGIMIVELIRLSG